MSSTDIPGDPKGLADLAAGFDAAAQHIQTVKQRVGENGLSDWTGDGGGAFREKLSGFPPSLADAVEKLSTAGTSLSTFARSLAEFQDTAAWQAQQIATSQANVDAAMQRQTSAELQVNSASLAQDLASDPISLNTARQAVDDAKSLFEGARADVAGFVSELSRLSGEADSNFAAYRAAVAKCCADIEAAAEAVGPITEGIGSHVATQSKSAGHGIEGWFKRATHDAAGAVKTVAQTGEHVAGDGVHLGEAAVTDVAHADERVYRDVDGVEVAIGHFEDRIGEDALHELDRHWNGIRRVVTDGTRVLGYLVPVALVAGAFVAPEIFIPAAGAMKLLGTGGAVATTAGDAIEARGGNQDAANRRLGRDHLLGDAEDDALSAIPDAPDAEAGEAGVDGAAGGAATLRNATGTNAAGDGLLGTEPMAALSSGGLGDAREAGQAFGSPGVGTAALSTARDAGTEMSGEPRRQVVSIAQAFARDQLREWESDQIQETTEHAVDEAERANAAPATVAGGSPTLFEARLSGARFLDRVVAEPSIAATPTSVTVDD